MSRKAPNRLLQPWLKGAIGLCSGLSLIGFSLPVAADHHLVEFDEAIKLKPDVENGKRLFKANCITCHGPEGWGVPGSGYPQIAGQINTVIIKQLADFRAGNRDNPIMRAFSSTRSLGGPQEIADVAAYVASMPMTPNNEQGFSLHLEEGKAIYDKLCADCHGKEGEGNEKDHIPLIQGQHYSYLARQFNWIRNGRRRNGDEKMIKQIKGFTPPEQVAVLSYVASLKPKNVAPPGWRNNDFRNFDRSWRPNKIN
ncbi:MAG TPA: cytochrome c4 [Thiolapillus brandeum]|uniref:Cytochrome c4 n=1 Tax=Thiolapillus brandeum TaxID=1076588 RepID=A0A831KBG5_9GAMM|nr:cytochrome c4 [Thiolapillus brandeum]